MLTNSKIALSVALALATASAAVGYPADGDPSCFDRESCRLADAVGQCVREHIRLADKAALRRWPTDRFKHEHLWRQLRIDCARVLRKN
jgi:hypothetical protein